MLATMASPVDELVTRIVGSLDAGELGEWMRVLNFIACNEDFLKTFGWPVVDEYRDKLLDGVLDEHRRRSLDLPADGWDLTERTTKAQRTVILKLVEQCIALKNAESV